MRKDQIRAKQPLSHGNVTDKSAKAKESAEIASQTEEFLKANGKVKKLATFITKVFSK